MMAIKEWTTQYPTNLDTDTQQPTLINNEDNTRVSQMHSLRDAVQELEEKVGSDNLEAGSLRKILSSLGSDGQVVYNNGGSDLGAASSLYWDESNKKLGVGTSSPIGELDVRAANGNGSEIYCWSVSDTATHKAIVRSGHQREGASPDTLNNDHLGGVAFAGHNGTGIQDAWHIYSVATTNFTTTNVKSNLYLTARNDTGWTTPLRLKHSGEVYGLEMYSGYTIGGTNKDVYIDSNGLIGVISSSYSTKSNISSMGDTSWLHNLEPATFVYDKDIEDKQNGEIDGYMNQYGLIAEQVEQVNTDFVSYDSDGYADGVLYSRFVPVLINEIKALRKLVEDALPGYDISNYYDGYDWSQIIS